MKTLEAHQSRRRPRAPMSAGRLRVTSIAVGTRRALSADESGACMELAFRTRKLRTLCLDHEEAVRTIGQAAADSLRTRVADLRAVTFLSELPAGRPDVLGGARPSLRFHLRDGWMLIARVSHEVIPRTPEGGLDMTRVRRALVEEVTR